MMIKNLTNLKHAFFDVGKLYTPRVLVPEEDTFEYNVHGYSMYLWEAVPDFVASSSKNKTPPKIQVYPGDIVIYIGKAWTERPRDPLYVKDGNKRRYWPVFLAPDGVVRTFDRLVQENPARYIAKAKSHDQG